MPSGIYAAASAMVSDTRAVEVVAENLANVNTTGFRRSLPMREDFAQVLQRQSLPPGQEAYGVSTARSHVVHEAGMLHETGAPFDMGLSGPGFFLVEDDQGRQLLTRAGNFAQDDQGRVVTDLGHPVQGQGGAITIPSDTAQVRIDQDGRIMARRPDGSEAFIDQVRVVNVDPADLSRLQVLNGTTFLVGNVPFSDASSTKIRQGFIEGANVEPVNELVRMIAIQRRYDAAARAMGEQLKSRDQYSDLLRG